MTVAQNTVASKIELLERFGRFQLFQWVLICLSLFFVPMFCLNFLFVAADVGHRCRVPECENENSSIEKPSWWPEDIDHKCLRPAHHGSNIACNDSSKFTSMEDCDDWIYENTYSIVSEFDIPCEPYKATLVGSIHNGGMIISMILMGWISDRIGRKPTTIICAVSGVLGLAKLIPMSYYVYVTIEFIESVLTSGLYTVGIVMMIEVGGKTKRVLAGVLFSFATYVGETVFAFLTIASPYWKHITLIIYTPSFIFISYALLLKESTRWHMLKGRTTEAKQTLKLIAKINKIDITAEEIDSIPESELRTHLCIEVKKEKEKFMDIICSKEIMTRLFVTSICYFTAGFVYYGLTVHSVLLPGNKHYNYALTAMISFPGDLLALFTFNKYGRRISLQCGFFACAIFLVGQWYTPDRLTWLKLVLFLAGKLSVALCFTGMFTYSLELFPTSVRGSLVGFGNTASRVGSMLAPLTPLLDGFQLPVPTILFTITAVMSGLLLLFVPETKYHPLYDTIAQIEDSTKRKVIEDSRL